MLRRLLIAGLVAAQVACGAASGTSGPSPSPRMACGALQVRPEKYDLSPSTAPTSGFDLRNGTQPVGIIADGDGSSVWILGTGSDSVIHVSAGGRATAYPLPHSGLGIQMSQAADGTVWAPEQYRDAIVSIAPDGSVR